MDIDTWTSVRLSTLSPTSTSLRSYEAWAGRAVKGIEHWLNSEAQRVMRSRWRPITSSVHQRSILGAVLFNVFINNQQVCP